MVRTDKNTFYIGQTNNLGRRLMEHREKGNRCARYLQAFKNFVLVYTEIFATRSEAMRREYSLKQLKHAQKEQLVITPPTLPRLT